MKNQLKWGFALLLYFISVNTEAQTFGNEWINYNQKYYAMDIHPESPLSASFGATQSVFTGVHRIEYDALVASGIDVSQFNSENIQIFGREKEIPLHIVDGGDSSIDPGDYILFYTERNDGWLDSTLYQGNGNVGNPYYSLYNDTIQYFFTWNNSTNNLRYTVEGNSDFSSYTPASHVMYDRWQSNTQVYEESARLDKSVSSFFTHGEGWTSYKQNGVGGPTPTWNAASVQLQHYYQAPGAPDVVFHGMHMGLSVHNHHVRYGIGSSNFVFVDSVWNGYKSLSLKANIPNSILPASGNSGFYVDIVDDQGSLTDYQSISTWAFLYPRVPNFNGSGKFRCFAPNSPTEAKIRIDFSNVNFNTPIVLAHGDIPRLLNISQIGSNYVVVLPNSANGVDQEIIYQEASTIRQVNSLTPVNGTGNFTNFAALPNIDEALLMVYPPMLEVGTDAYIGYRNSTQGGSHNTIKANVEELYQQFGGGIRKHINGIRRFSHFIHNQSTQKPEGLFLIGKGIREAKVGNDHGTRKSASVYNASLVPSFGHPSSDIAITADLEGPFSFSPLIPTGRITVRSNEELKSYLNKVIAYEAQQDSTHVYDTPGKDWQKQVIHFTGGSDISQQNQFQGYMNSLEYKISDSLFGANVTRVYKDDSDPLNPTILQEVTDKISNGVSLMSYFGHASATNSGFEINLDEPGNWNNSGKYPLMLVNSCYNGNIYQLSSSTSEEFVKTPNAGAIGYIASTNLGYDGPLIWYSRGLYDFMGKFNYGGRIGEQMKQNIENLEPSATGPSALLYESTCTQMVLNGDPMLRLNWHTKPEIELLEENISFSPSNLDLSTDSIEMTIDLKNLGRSITDTFDLEVIRDFPNSSDDSTYHFSVPGLHYTTQFSFKMPMQPTIGIGLNNFTVSVDLPSQIDEVYDEIGNNQITKSLLIDVDGIIPIIPYKFAVVPNDSVTVIASTNNPIADFNTYRFELDTIDFVGTPSPFHRYALVSGLGGLKEVNPSEWIRTNGGNGTLTCEDSTVYFWRVSVEGDTVWRESSFQYIPNKEGWGQDHFFQFKENSFNNVDYVRSTRTRNFVQNDKTIECDVRVSLSEHSSNAYYIDDYQQEYDLCTFTPSLHVVVIDPITHVPWGTRHVPTGQNLSNNFGNANDNTTCRDRVEKYFIFRETSATSLSSFQNMVLNEVPDGHYILVYSPNTTNYASWDVNAPSMYATFAALGSDSIYPGRPELPFAFFCKKGDPSSVVEYCSQDATDDFVLSATLEGYDNIGLETAPLIGPASTWREAYWKQDPMETSSTDTTVLTIKAYDQAGNFQMSIDTAFTLDGSILNLGSLIDANQYPFINLSAYYVDSTALTPAQIDRWHILFDPLPEAAIDGSSAFTWSAGDNNTVTTGEGLQFAVDIKNIFTKDMDSLLVNYWIEDNNNNIQPINYPRQDSLRVGETLRDTITVNTGHLSGINYLWMEVNPYTNPLQLIKDQPEQYHFNNILQIPFIVHEDTINPILDVTFNGNHILNGDIVDPYGEVLITLKDENQFLIMDDVSDTTAFGVYLEDPNGNTTKIPFVGQNGETVMQWVPATPQNRRFKIIWPTEFDQDGEYKLLVQGTDKSGNISGDIEYRVNFNIVHASTITRMMNYPNPFSTSTRFVFTLTGSEAPDNIIIQIMTVSGRVVREITEDELGTIQIGRNITEYAWDGTDEFGDPLANGVYLYRVKAQINGEDIEHRNSGADNYFKKDFGKMYILR